MSDRPENKRDRSTKREVIHPSELMADQFTLTVDEERRWRAAHAVPFHCHGHPAISGFIDANGETKSIFVNKGGEGDRCHSIVMLEDGVQADHLKSVLTEHAVYSLSLRESMRYAAGAEHLKGMN